MELHIIRFCDKLQNLLLQLVRTNKELEMVADEMSVNTLRSAFDSLSVESSMYASELSSALQLNGMEGFSIRDFYEDPFQAMPVDPPPANGQTELEIICARIEDRLTKAYHDVLETAVPFASLKEMMMLQLKGLKNNFLIIRSLVSPALR